MLWVLPMIPMAMMTMLMRCDEVVDDDGADDGRRTKSKLTNENWDWDWDAGRQRLWVKGVGGGFRLVVICHRTSQYARCSHSRLIEPTDSAQLS